MLESDSTKDQQGLRGESLMTEQGNVEDRGMSEDYDLWLAELKKQEAEKMLQWLREELKITKGRASNLLGWMITLTVAMGTISFSKNNPYPVCTLIMGVGFLITAFLCIKVMFATKWKIPLLKPEFISKRSKEFAVSDKAALMEDLAQYIDNCMEQNALYLVKDQATMRWCWRTVSATPVIAFAFLVLFFLLEKFHYFPGLI